MFIAFERLDFHSTINHDKIGASLCKSKLSVCDESLFSFSNERDQRDEDKYLIRNTGWVLWALLFKVLQAPLDILLRYRQFVTTRRKMKSPVEDI